MGWVTRFCVTLTAMFEKTCSKCGETRPVSEYHRKTASKDGLSARCKPCVLAAVKEYRTANVDKVSAVNKAYRRKNFHKVSQRQKEWRASNRQRVSQVKKTRYEANKTQIIKKVTEWQRNNSKLSHVYRASRAIRAVIYQSLRRKGFTKRSKTTNLLGCDWATFEQYLSSRFAEGMSWDNRSEWHVDHIIPLATAKTIEDVERLCHYTNLQPLWAADNIRKGAKIMT